MRGKGVNVAVSDALVGITPAYAGKRNVAMRQKYAIWDHPRVCGEKPALCNAPVEWVGSPPRMRGKGRKGHGSRHQTRITPAYAGKNL